MPNSKQIVYLSQAQYAELIANGSITVNGVTVTYNENDIYVTPQAEPVTDVRINGTSIAANGVADIPKATTSVFGAASILNKGGLKLNSEGRFYISTSSEAQIKAGTGTYKPLTAPKQHIATFYGLAKAAGHDEASSTESLGTYTPEAKGAIQQMLGVSDLIATPENDLVASKAYKVGEVFTANGKLYKATAAIAADAAIITDGANANCEETSIGEGFVKFTDYATTSTAGVVKIGNTNGGFSKQPDGTIVLYPAQLTALKQGYDVYNAIIPSRQHYAAFYGLAKAAGADEKDSTLPVGEYTNTAKSAIRTMLGAASNNIIAISDTAPTDPDTKIWIPETATSSVQVPTVSEMESALAGKVGDVQIGGTSIVSNGVAEIPIANGTNAGVVKVNDDGTYGIRMLNGQLAIRTPASTAIKNGTSGNQPITPLNQNEATFYGLAKAAGDTTQAASDNAVGTYTDDAKAAIRTMLGAVGDVQVNGTSVVSNGVANIPQGSGTARGVFMLAREAEIKEGVSTARVLTPGWQHTSTFYALAKAAGDTTQSASSNAVGTYTDNAKASIKSMLGIVDGSTGTVDVTGATPTINAVENTRYVCGEVTSLSFTPPSSGISIVRFTSGSTVTVLTIPNTVKFPEWFDPTALETNTIYEICVTDGTFGAVMSWAL